MVKGRKAERDWMSATLWRTCLDFSTPKNALSDSGSVALTPISAYTFALPCATVMRERTMCLRARRTESEGKYAIVRKCNPLTSAPASTRKHLLVTVAHMLAPTSAAWRHFRYSVLPLWPSSLRWLHGKQTFTRRKPPVHFPQKENRSMIHSWNVSHGFTLFCHSTFHLSRRHLSHPVPAFHCNQGSYYLKCSAHQQRSL